MIYQQENGTQMYIMTPDVHDTCWCISIPARICTSYLKVYLINGQLEDSGYTSTELEQLTYGTGVE